MLILFFKGPIIENIEAISHSSRSIHISWEPVSGHNDILDYSVNVSLVGSNEDPITIVTNSTSVVVDSLHPDYLYQCSVAARNSAGLGAAKTVLERTLPDGKSGDGLYTV